MVQASGAPSTGEVSAWLEKWLRFHHTWRVRTMLAYGVTTIVAMVASTAGGIVAALKWQWSNEWAAALAGLTAVALAIEKSLLFREKWRLHLTVYLELEAIKLKFETGQCAQKCTVDQAAAVLSRYGHDLPIGPREAG